MKRITLFICFCFVGLFFFAETALSQGQPIEDPDANQLNFTGSPEIYSFFNGHKANAKNNINNLDALLCQNWMRGVVNFKNGKQFSNAALKFDLFRNELYFRKDNIANTFVEPVSSFYLLDSTNGIDKIAGFRNGYPPFGWQSEKNFYLVLASGPYFHLLKYISKKARPLNEDGAASQGTYRLIQDLYLYDAKNKRMRIIPKTSANALKNILPVYARSILQQYENKNKRLSTEALIDLINQVNNVAVPAS